MGHIERTIEIKTPPEKVWLLITDFERLPEVVPEVEKFTITSYRRSGAGMIVRQIGVESSGRYQYDFEVTELIENKKIVLKSISAKGAVSGTKWEVSWTLNPTKIGTQLTYAADYKFPILFRIFGRSAIKRLETQVEGWLKNIRSKLEKQID